jgi:hypothetical protein
MNQQLIHNNQPRITRDGWSIRTERYSVTYNYRREILVPLKKNDLRAVHLANTVYEILSTARFAF